MRNSRRTFIKTAGYGTAAAVLLSQLPSGLYSQDAVLSRADLELYGRLLKEWCDGLIKCQGADKLSALTFGGFMCPACGFIHGRSAEAAFPLLYMADHSKDQKYLDAALNVFNWGECNVSQQDGSWINDVTSNPWKGITVFGASALGESLKYHAHLLDSLTLEQWYNRLKKACEFLYGFITPDTSNVNYPLCASYPLLLGGKLLKEQKFIDRAAELAHIVYQYISPEDGFIFGELKPRTKSKLGYWPVDISYNVEETLPTLTLYALEAQDEKLLNTVLRSWKTHVEFMLPDGGWDDSFGTRNHKWTYWGSRNSDGCQAGLALLGEREPVLAEAAYRNAQMLEKCTQDGILYGGPGYVSHGVKPCIHHNFAHAKSLASLLNEKKLQQEKFVRTTLPREKINGLRIFKDIGTQLISVGKWRATVTANDCEYRVSPHASGGSISLLYHEDIGLILTDSLFPELKLRERSNMQGNDDALQLLLTPRLEMMIDGIPYRSSRDLGAIIASQKTSNGIQLTVKCKLLTHNLEDTPGGVSSFDMDYLFRPNGLEIRISGKATPAYDDLAFYLPVVSPAFEKITIESAESLIIDKAKQKLKITTSGKLNILKSDQTRIFSQSPGVEAIPLKIDWDLKKTPALNIRLSAE